MSRKYSTKDRDLFQQVFLQFAWIPPAHLAGLMRTLAGVDAVPEKWSDFHGSTASRWINDGKWRDHADALSHIAQDDEALPTDDAVDDRVMRRNLQVFDILTARILGDAGDANHLVRHYIDLQREIRTHAHIRRSIPLTPSMLIELFLQAGHYVAGKAFDTAKAQEFLIAKLAQARQLMPVRVS